MNKTKALVILVLLLYVLSVTFHFGSEDVIANALESFILPVITLLYFITVKRKSLFFTLFLVLFSISDLMIFIGPYIPYDLDYYLGNFLYISAYISLSIEIFKSVSLSYILKNYKLHLLILTILNIYIIYVLQVIVDPHVGETNIYYVELLYNIVMLTLLSGSLMNYFYRDNVKSLFLFLGSLCIVFGEVIWVAYIYISERYLLNVVSTTLYLVAFYFFYKQSKIKQDIRREEENMFLS
ncbi:hypothetical protein EV196_108144 [Mariniflexile fucanivorans]|uniref:YhhN-like protein n=1 Tax=Mariniflexile fucanivorans TaxID=264023 RepID=A0A4R1RDK2_9FLAO|nr:hypothetical protein [Mariniflexile fucanivorans]TCL63948.1 hypothetical protein EV196_108144 [Mariniflexile fucanivorans]